jgi:phosphatidylglycerol:prolipoprotein diacylglycerol transferase
MRQTLFVIPRQIGGVDVFGFGWLLGIWLVVSAVIMARSIKRYGWRAESRSHATALGIVAFIIAFVLPLLTKPEGVHIRGYGVMLLVSVLSGIGLSVYRAIQKGVDPDIIFSLATWLFLCGIVGARAF